jgi:peroxiredoxin (alkyl hydroperoxide reductase subunit C)
VLGQEGSEMGVFVGKEAPDFKTKAYYQESTKEIRLLDYRGSWVLLLFYPADFTCV